MAEWSFLWKQANSLRSGDGRCAAGPDPSRPGRSQSEKIGGKSTVKSDLDFGSKCYFGWKLPSWYMLSSRQPRACSWWHRRRAQTHHSHWCSNQQNACICFPSSQDVQHGNSNAHMRKRQKGRVRAARNQAALIQMGGCLFNFFKLVARCVVWNHANTIASTHQKTCFDISTSSTCIWGMLMRSISISHPLVLALHATLQHLPLSRAQICFYAWPSSTCFAPTLQHRSPAPAFDAALQHLTLALARM